MTEYEVHHREVAARLENENKALRIELKAAQLIIAKLADERDAWKRLAEGAECRRDEYQEDARLVAQERDEALDKLVLTPERLKRAQNAYWLSCARIASENPTATGIKAALLAVGFEEAAP